MKKDPENEAIRVIHLQKGNNVAIPEDTRYTLTGGPHGAPRVVWLSRDELAERRKAWRTPATEADAGPATRLDGYRQLGQERAAERLSQARERHAAPAYAAVLTTGFGTNRRTTRLGRFATAADAQRVCELRPEAAFVPGGLT